MKKPRPITIIGFVAMLGGAIFTALGEWANEKKMEEMVDEKVEAAFKRLK